MGEPIVLVNLSIFLFRDPHNFCQLAMFLIDCLMLMALQKAIIYYQLSGSLL